MALMEKVSNRAVEKEKTPNSGNVLARVNQILGYDLDETRAVERDRDLFRRVVARLGNGETVPASEIFGSTLE